MRSADALRPSGEADPNGSKMLNGKPDPITPPRTVFVEVSLDFDVRRDDGKGDVSADVIECFGDDRLRFKSMAKKPRSRPGRPDVTPPRPQRRPK